MARDIVDDIVRNGFYSGKFDLSIKDAVLNNPKYRGKVEDKPIKINLCEQSEFGLRSVGISESLKNKFQMFQSIPVTESYVALKQEDGSEHQVPIKANQLAMLKALALEQVNPCDAYSKLIYELFWDYMRAVVRGNTASGIETRHQKKTWEYEVYTNLINYMISMEV